MTRIIVRLLLLSIAISLEPPAPSAQEMMSPEPADLILRNGLVYTVDSTNTMTEAVAIRSGKFVFVGSNKDVLRYRGKQTRVIDLKGQFVLPGFSDNHVHFASAAQFLEFNIMRVTTQQEFAARVSEVTARLPKGEWILGGTGELTIKRRRAARAQLVVRRFHLTYARSMRSQKITRCSFESSMIRNSPRMRRRCEQSE